MTWRDIAALYPDFVQWVVQVHGPRHDGPVTEEEYTLLKMAYEARP